MTNLFGLQEVFLEVITPTGMEPTGLGFDAPAGWKLQYPDLEDEVAIVDHLADVLETDPNDIIDELYEGQSFRLKRTIIQLDGVLLLDPIYMNFLKQKEGR